MDKKILDHIIDSGLRETEKKGSFSKDAFHKIKNDVYKDYDVAKPFASTRILQRYNERIASGELKENESFKKVLRKR